MCFDLHGGDGPLSSWRRGCRQLVGLVLLVACSLWAGPLWAAPQAYWLGLDFIDSPISLPIPFSFPPTDFEPFPITAAGNHFVTQGGLAGWTEEQARRAVALAVEDVFAALDVGNLEQTIRLGIYLGSVPGSLAGQRLNLVLGQPTNSVFWLGNTPRPGDYENGQANDTVVAAVNLNNIDNLGTSLVTYDTAAGVINAIAGTTAHEIGHIFGATHVATSVADPTPLPIMASGMDGLPTEARLTERRFSLDLPAGMSNSELLIQNIGTVPRGDFNLDAQVDGNDLTSLLANWGLADRLTSEGDANGDHRIDGTDFLIWQRNFGSPLSMGSSIEMLPSLLAAEWGLLDAVGAAAPVAVPEANGLLLACCGWGGLLLINRRDVLPRQAGFRSPIAKMQHAHVVWSKWLLL